MTCKRGDIGLNAPGMGRAWYQYDYTLARWALVDYGGGFTLGLF